MTASYRSRNIANVKRFGKAFVVGCSVLLLSTPLLAQAPKSNAPAPVPTQQKPAQPNPAQPNPAQPNPAQPNPAQPAVVRPADVMVPSDYVVGADDVLGIVYWRDKEMSTDARVRPDGRIAIPLINEVMAS